MRKERKKIRPIRIHQYLSGIPLPVTREEIVEYVQNRGPDNAVMDRISLLPHGVYRNEAEILGALGRLDSHIISIRSLFPEIAVIPQALRLSEDALIMTLGKQCAHFYAVEDGTIRHVESFKFPRHRYSDAEGHFKVRIKEGAIRSGAPRELESHHISRHFLNELRLCLSRINAQKYPKVFAFAPSYFKNQFLNTLSPALRKNVEIVAEGVFYKSHPLSLVRKIKASQKPEPAIPVRIEVRKIIAKSEQARSVIRSKR